MEKQIFTNEIILSWLQYYSQNTPIDLEHVKIIDITKKNKNVIPTVEAYKTTLVFTNAGIDDIFYRLWNAGLGESEVWYNEGSDPSGDILHNQIKDMINRGINASAGMLIINPNARNSSRIGLSNEKLQRGSIHYVGSEIRSIILSKMMVDSQDDICVIGGESIAIEAALIAARHNKESVDKDDFNAAVDRIIGGLEKRSKILTDEEKRSIAVHEAGHATVSWHLRYGNPLVKVTIVPRGKALGAAWYLPEERQIVPSQVLLDDICSLLGGRAAEEIFLGHISTGAANDLERVTKQAYAMVVYYGMSERLPNLSYYDSTGQNSMFTNPYSDERATIIDQEVSRIIAEQYERAKSILREHAEGHNSLAETLISREVIFTDDVERIFGPRQWTSRTDELFGQKDNGPVPPPIDDVEATEVKSSDKEEKQNTEEK